MNVYDFDGTIYNGDSTLDFYKYFFRRNPKLIRFVFSQIIGGIKYFLGIYDKTMFKESFYCFLAGIDCIEDYISDFWKKNQYHIKTWYLQQKKEEDVIISASPDFLLEAIGKELEISCLICSNVDKKSGKYRGINCFGEEKVQRFQKIFGKEAVIDAFYSDSLSDAPLAQIAKNSYIVIGEKIIKWEQYERTRKII